MRNENPKGIWNLRPWIAGGIQIVMDISTVLHSRRKRISVEWRLSVKAVHGKRNGGDSVPEAASANMANFGGHDLGVQQSSFAAQLQKTLNAIPAYTWYKLPLGALTFVNERSADYLGLPKDHPLRFGIDTGAAWDSHIVIIHPDDRDVARKSWEDCLKAGSAGEASFRIRNSGGEYRWFLCRCEPFRASDGTLLYWLGISLDIDAQKRADFYVVEGQRLALTGSWALSTAGFEFWSTQLFRIHGLEPKEKAPSIPEYIELVHPEDRDFVTQEIRKMLSDQHGFDFTKRFVRPDGDVRYVHCVGVPAGDGFVGTEIDVTAQEQLASALRKSQEELEKIIDLTPQLVCALGPGRERLYANRILFDYFGFTLDEWRSSPGTEVHPDDSVRFRSHRDRAVSDGSAFETEVRLRRRDGKYRWHLVRYGPLRDDEGKILRWYVACTDIEERKQSEFYLLEAQRLARTGSWAFNAAGFEYWSDQLFEIYGLKPRDKAPSAPEYLQLVHPEDRDFVAEEIRKMLSDHRGFDFTKRIVRPDGDVRYVHCVGVPAGDGFAGTGIDVTEQEHLTRALRKSQEELQKILDFTPQFVAIMGPRRERLYANQVVLDYHGITLAQWWEGSPGSYTHPDDSERLRPYLERAGSEGLAYSVEARLRGRDGSYRWHLARYNPLHDDEGKLLRWYVACTDIEDRKRDEERLQRENIALREQISQASMFEEIVGTSAPLQKVLTQVSKAAPSDSTILVLGETGTGKELIARAIHERSSRVARAFIGVNCAAIPASLIASELFGHEKGAFTGAIQRRLGRFEAAHGGTIFLDEVGDLPIDIQIALLRVLQEHEIERIGCDKPIAVDVRVIAATHRDLKKLVREGKFRQDLFYRLNVVPITVPTLRERTADIPLLVEYFIARFGRKTGKKFRRIEKSTLEALKTYEWPGNVRELQNVIERAVTLSDSDIFAVDEAWLKGEPSEVSHPNVALSGALSAREKEAIEAALTQSRGRVSGLAGAAAKLGVPATTLDSKIKRLGIDKYWFKRTPH
jgi:PAS domain S-box-containing protein